jgi:hypothetical protein
MDYSTFTAEIELIAGAGDADDAMALMRRLLDSGQTKMAIAVRRGVKNGKLDAEALLASGRKTVEEGMQEDERARQRLRAASRDLIRHGGDNILTRAAGELARFI